MSSVDSRRSGFRAAAGGIGELVYVLPLVALVAIAVLIPSAQGAFESLYNWHPGYSSPFVGDSNYRFLLNSANFREILRNQLVLLVGLPLWVGVPLFIAVLLRERVPAPSAFAAIFLLPAILSPTLIAIAVLPILGDNGFLNSALRAIGLGVLARGWLTDPHLVKFTLIGIFTWAWSGIGVVIFLAAFSAVPPALLEAIRVEGGRLRDEVRYVLMPGVWPVVAVFTFIQLINVFSPFGLIFVLTGGGPGYSSTTIDFDIYQNAFQYGFFGLAAAESVIMLVIVLAICGLGLGINRLQERQR